MARTSRSRRPRTAPSAVDADLLVLAAPTHNMGLPSKTSRASAVSRGAPGQTATRGVREWVDSMTPTQARVVTVDTVSGSGMFSGSAAKATVKLLRRRRVAAERGESFLVAGDPPALRDGELERARSWGRRLHP